MKRSFREKVCVVTGAGSGIGRALALDLARQGAALALSDKNAASLAETAALLTSYASNRIRTDVLDVSDADAIELYAPMIRESLGPADCVFNVAGLSRIGSFNNTSLASFESVLNVNFWGTVRMSKAFLGQLVETKGAIVNISSVFGLIAVPGQAHYCASKFAVRGFSETIAAELESEDVHVACVHPGGVATNIARSAIVDAMPKNATSSEDLAARFDKIAITSPERAAEIILDGVKRGKRRIMIGRDAKIVSFLQRMFPAGYPAILKRLKGDALT